VSSACPVCSTREMVAIEYRPRVPIQQTRVWPEGFAARATPVGATRATDKKLTSKLTIRIFQYAPYDARRCAEAELFA
jgi:hypothetical protein